MQITPCVTVPQVSAPTNLGLSPAHASLGTRVSQEGLVQVVLKVVKIALVKLVASLQSSTCIFFTEKDECHGKVCDADGAGVCLNIIASYQCLCQTGVVVNGAMCSGNNIGFFGCNVVFIKRFSL